MKMGMNAIGHGRTNALDRFEVLKSGGCDSARRSEMQQQRLFAFRPNARNVINGRGRHGFSPAGAVTFNGKPMGLVPQPLQEIECW